MKTNLVDFITGIPQALDGEEDGQRPRDKRGLGYHGEKIVFAPNMNKVAFVFVNECLLGCRVLFARRKGALGCLLNQSSTFYDNVFLFVAYTTLGLFFNFDWLVNEVGCPNVSTTN